ncbi:MAG: hypothetical protein AAFO06_23655, partial [Cyanobacteria bacterium J06597_16]
MTTTKESSEFFDRLSAFHEQLVEDLTPQLLEKPELAGVITERLEKVRADLEMNNLQAMPPADGGLAKLVGIGPEAAGEVGDTHLPAGVEDYDETVSSDRILAIADLYYLYQHEKLGVFKAVKKLQQLFNAGAVRLSSGQGAYGLYRFDRRQVLRYTTKDRLQAYRRALGYTKAPLVPEAKANAQFHPMFMQFNQSVAQFWRDKRVSDVIRSGGNDPSFGSVSTVRRAGLDLRNNLKWASYGHINMMRIEVLQLLEESFRILNAADVKRLFGADNGWDVVEEVMKRYFKTEVNASQRHRMAVSGRNVLRWLAIEHILKSSQTQFEALLQEIANDSEEWLTSAETIGLLMPMVS